jgi:L-histidine N-alpha-methyltransferase
MLEDNESRHGRLHIHRPVRANDSIKFAEEVRAGLTANPKSLLPKYFYDRLGSHLFEAISCLPEYYVTRAEHEILQNAREEIIDSLGLPAEGNIRMIELGSGSAEKTHQLIKALLSRDLGVHYVPIDISDTSLTHSSEMLVQEFPNLRLTGYVNEYEPPLEELAAAGASEQDDRTIILFLGSSIGNLSPDGSKALLNKIRNVMRPGDVLLLGADLKKSSDILLPAYNDALMVTAAFNLNVLLRINRELNGNFDISRFEHRALHNEELSRIEMHLFSRDAHTVRLGTIDLEIAFVAGESIHTENSYKYDIAGLARLAETTRFHLERTWYDSMRYFGLSLLVAV